MGMGKMVKPLMMTFVYNERKYLPHAIEYYKRNNCDVYIIDNYSNDGTWEWLQENNIPSHRLDTNGEFALKVLQADFMETLKKLKPNWVMYGAGDLYHIFDKPIDEALKEIEDNGYNAVNTQCYSAVNTGEVHKIPLPINYLNLKKYIRVRMIARWSEDYNINGDEVNFEGLNPCDTGISVNYGLCKTLDEWNDKLERRKKAWESGGADKKHGKHLVKYKTKDLIYPLKDYENVKNLDILPLVKKTWFLI